MKEVCGFEDSNGNFHKTKKGVEEAEAKIKISNITNTLDYLSNRVGTILDDNYRDSVVYGSNHVLDRERVFQSIANVILMDSGAFMEILLEKKNLRKELDLLRERDSRWWLRFKWW